MCPACLGRRSLGGMILDKCNVPNCETHQHCWECHYGPGPCFLHTCPRCQGSGLVCPICRGDRIVQLGNWETARPVVKYMRCDACCEGNQVNPAKELRAIDAYLRKHGPSQPELKVVKS